MGWVTEDELHEGYPVAVLADGRDATAADNPKSGNSAWWCFDGTEGKPRAVGVRAGCDCYDDDGEVVARWRGATVHPVYFGDVAATGGWPGEDGGNSPYTEWERTHVAPAAATTVPADVTELVDRVRDRLGELTHERPLAALTAVARLEGIATASARTAASAAQDRDHSWAEIGTALGVSKQAAHQRLARRTQPEIDPELHDRLADFARREGLTYPTRTRQETQDLMDRMARAGRSRSVVLAEDAPTEEYPATTYFRALDKLAEEPGHGNAARQLRDLHHAAGPGARAEKKHEQRAGRCAASHPDDPVECTGAPDAVTLVDAHSSAVTGCETHGARMLASLEGATVEPGTVVGAATRVVAAADTIRPFPWYEHAPRTEPHQRSRAENRAAGTPGSDGDTR
jgi:hypothetical protein